ncbi:hypothetical protein WJN01_09375 [Flavobacteriaceae bacterium SZ-1-7]|uniref:hypothetical protein n=1 Tax=Tamlana sedimenti TaxID=3134126 RepID=UPI003128F85B
MKRVLLVCAGLLIGLTTASATETTTEKPKTKIDINNNYRYAEPIMFLERGIEFLIFPDGSFDFNTHINNNGHNDDFYFRNSNSRRGSINASYSGPNVSVQYSSDFANRGVSISRDRDGKIRRIGHVYLNYNRYGKITRVGSVFIGYGRGRTATLTQVGGLHVNYNRWGEIVSTHGKVNRYDSYCNFCGDHSCTISHEHGNNGYYHDDHDNYDDGYYYYKQNGKVKKQKKNKR